MDNPRPRAPGSVSHWAVLTAALIAILVLTLAPSSPQQTESIFACVFCGDKALADVLVNIILYIPLGIGLMLVGVRLRHVVLLGIALSGIVEATQVVLPGRDASVGDVISNTLGTGAGALLALSARAWLYPSRRTAGVLSLGWATFTLAVFCGTGYLLAPSFPHTEYWGQWTPNLGHLEWYRGRIVTATVGGEEIRSRRAPDSDRLRRHLLEGAPVEVLAIAGPRTERLASLFSIADQLGDGILLLGPDRDDFVLRYRTRAADFRLDQPDLRLVGAMAAIGPADTLHVQAALLSSGSHVRVSGRVGEVGHTVGSGWALLYYAESLPEWFKAALSVGWVAGLLFWTGFWARRNAASVLAAAVALGSLAAAPALTGLMTTAASQWIAGVGGMVVGLAAAAWVRHTKPIHDAAALS